jgi:hypothetical protein
MNDLEVLELEYKATKDPERQAELRKEMHETIKGQYEFSFDLENLPPQKHIWVDRGQIMSCEGAGHANHRHHKY